MTLHDQQLNSTTFHAWKMIFLNFMTFQVFHDLCNPARVLKLVVASHQSSPTTTLVMLSLTKFIQT